MKATTGAAMISDARLLEFGKGIWDRMESMKFLAFTSDNVRRAAPSDEELQRIIISLASESNTTIFDCGRVISAALRRVVKATAGSAKRLEDYGSVDNMGRIANGRPSRFFVVNVATEVKPEPEPAKPAESVPLTDADRIIAAIERIGDRIEAAIRFR